MRIRTQTPILTLAACTALLTTSTLLAQNAYITDDSGGVSVLDTQTETFTAYIPVGRTLGIAVTPDGSRVYVSNFDDGNVVVISTATNGVTAVIPNGYYGFIAVSPDGSRVYVAYGNNSVSVIATANNTVIDTVGVGTYPRYLAIQPRSAFSAFSAKLDLVPALFGSFDLNATLQLSAGWSIDPATEPVTFSVGPYQVTIPAGSFHQLKNGSKSGAWVFSGSIAGVSLSVQIDPLGGNAYQFKSTGSPVNFTGVTSPTAVSISINGSYSTTQAKF